MRAELIAQTKTQAPNIARGKAISIGVRHDRITVMSVDLAPSHRAIELRREKLLCLDIIIPDVTVVGAAVVVAVSGITTRGSDISAFPFGLSVQFRQIGVKNRGI